MAERWAAICSARLRSVTSRITAMVAVGRPAASRIRAAEVSTGTAVPSRRRAVYSTFLCTPISTIRATFAANRSRSSSGTWSNTLRPTNSSSASKTVQFPQLPGCKQDFSLEVGHHDGIGTGFRQTSVLLFALMEPRLGPFPFRHVPEADRQAFR